MRVSLEKKLIGIFVLVFVALIVLGWETYSNNKKYQDTTFWIFHTQEVLYQSEQIATLNKDAETAIRGYVLAGDEDFLHPFTASKESIFTHLDALKKLTSDNAIQQKRLDTLTLLIKHKMAFSQSVISAFNEQGFEAAREAILTRKGLGFMNAISGMVANIQQEENRLLAIRRTANAESNLKFNRVYITQLIIIILVLFFSFAFIINTLKARKKVQKLLRENQRLLQSIIDNTTSIIYLKDAAGRYLMVNKQFEKVSGKTSQEIIGRTNFDIFSAEHATLLKAEDDKVWNENKLLEFEEDFHVDGQSIHFLSIKFPLYKEAEKPYAVCTISTDITQIKKQANLINDLYDNAPCGYYSLDENNVILQCNNTTAEWLGYSKKELIGKDITDILTPESKIKVQEGFAAFKEKGISIGNEFNYVRKDETILPVLLNAHVEKDEKGNFLYARSSIFDITERKKLEEGLKSVNKELESFTYSVSHDLRAPLRIIDGYAGIILSDYANELNDDVKRMLDNIITNANRMGKLIDDLLSFSRLGRKELIKHETNMNALVQPILNEQLKIAAPLSYQVEIGDLGHCYCDSNLMKHVWQNLISNAIKYSRNQPHPCVVIGCQEKERETIYYVKDNGAGFDMQYYDKLFGVFQRLHKVSEYEGTGVGLALVQRIVLKHGGHVWAQSAPEQGATFYFSIPNSNHQTIKL